MDNNISNNVARKYLYPEGVAGAKEKVRLIWQFIRYGWQDPIVIRQTEDIVRFVRERDKEAEARAIYEWVKSNTRYTHGGLQKIKTAGYQIEEFQRAGKITGNCANSTVLIAAMGGTIGLQMRLVVLGDENNWYHIYPEVLLGKWITMDVVGSQAAFGRAIPGNKIIAESKEGGIGMIGDIMTSPTTKVDAQGNVYVLEGDGIGASKKWKKIGKIVKKVGKVLLPVSGIIATTLWAKGAIDRNAKAVAAKKAKIAAAKARGNIIITDSSGRDQEVPAYAATPTMVSAAQQEAAMTTPPAEAPAPEYQETTAPSSEGKAAPEGKKDNTMIYLALGAAALLLFGKGKKAS